MGSATIKPGVNAVLTIESELDSDGDEVTNDPVVSASWTTITPDVSVTAAPDSLSAVVTPNVSGFLGDVQGSMSGTTQNGNAVTGDWTATWAQGMPVTVVIKVSPQASPDAV